MPLLHSRSPLKRRSVQALLLLAFLVLLFIALPQTEYGASVLRVQSRPTYTETGHVVSNQEYEAALVVASQKKDDTTWLRGKYPAWRKSIYVVDNPRASLTVPVNKGRESMVYLSYIIDNYDTLENVTIFVHAERYQWHIDDPDYDAQRNLARLNISHIRDQGYVNLRCAWVLGCPAELHPLTDFGHTSDPPKAGEVYQQSFRELFPGIEIPEVVGTPCCAQIAVSKETIRRRPKEDYMRYKMWLIRTDLADSLSGRVLEYSWHIIFGKKAVFCPDAKECYCQLYGLCDLYCAHRDACKGRYTLAKFSSLPEGWPEVDWDGQPRQVHDY